MCLQFLNTYSQEIQFPTQRLKYFQYTNKAELAICKNEYSKAISLYDSAIYMVKKPNYRDLYNLALCHKNIGNSKQSDTLFAFLLAKGYGKSFISCCYDTIKNIIPKKEPILINGKNLDDLLIEIFKDDQRANSIRYQSMEAYAQIVIENAKKIMSLIQQVEVPMILDVKGELYFPILHFFQLKGFSDRVKKDSTFKKQWIVYRCLEKFNFDEIHLLEFLSDLVSTGNYDRYTFANLFLNNGYYFGTPVSQYNEYIVVKSPDIICSKVISKINNSRKVFGLESYEDYFKKARFADSLITNGKPFISIPFEKYNEIMDEKEITCNFQMAKDYRLMMEFTKPEDAKGVYESAINNLCIKKNNP